VKVLNQEFPSAVSIKHFANEYDILQGVDVKGLRKVLGRGKLRSFQAIYLEYVEGKTLNQCIGNQLSIADKLTIAINLAAVIGTMHDNTIIHKDITPSNVLVNPDTKEVTMIDFGISSRFTLKNQHLGNPQRLEGTLTYLSPEQTGRMNRVVDYRTDIYSAGVVLYQLFSGRPPFVSEDAMAMVHAHIATIPPPLERFAPELPEVLNDIVQKMMAKNAEDRYQSAFGLEHDLKECLRKLNDTGQVKAFTIAENDFSSKFQLVEKLYGRDEEIARLLKAYETCAGGPTQTVLVSGFSGTGKSSLVQEVHKSVSEKRGYFIEGKYDQYQRSIPYSAVSQAFRNMINLLMTEDEWKLDYFRQRIQEAVGEEGAVLIEVLPELELIIGEQPRVAEVGGAEAQNRLNYIFRRFLGALCGINHPLALFVDDLQWADSASLDLIQVLLTDADNGHFLFIGAYRDNEVGASHPLRALIHALKETQVSIEEISIGNLSAESVNHLISDSLMVNTVQTKPLADLVVKKTGGNAFFVTQFLKSLYEDRLIQFDPSSRKWEWDIGKIRDQNLPDDVVDLMAGKIQRMSKGTQNVLKLAACVGASFDPNDLAVIAEEKMNELLPDIEPALLEGLVLAYEGVYRFSHDKVQQAAYSLIPEDERSDLHVRIGRLLLSRTSDKDIQDRLFDIVNQLNWGVGKLENKVERENLAKLNLRAAVKARESSAFEPAFSYVRTGIKLLGDTNWESQYKLSIDLYTEAAEIAFLCNQFMAMDGYIELVLGNAKELEEIIRPYEIRIHALKAQNKLLDALKTGLILMGRLGEKFPSKPNALMVMPDLIKTGLMLRGKSNEDLRDLPEITDPIKGAAIRALAGIAPSSYWANPAIFPFLIFRIVQLSIRYGNSPISSFGFATYGVIMVGVLNLAKTGYRFGKIGLSIVDKYKAKEWIAQIYTPVYALINIWNEHINKTLKPLRDSYHIGLETGAIEFACINANIYCIHAFFIGNPLNKLAEETHDYSQHFKRFGQDTNYIFNEIFRQGMLNFIGEAAGEPTTLSGTAIDEQSMIEESLETKNRMALFQVYLNKMIVCNYFGDYQGAWDAAVQGRPLLDSVLAKLEVAYFHFHEGLAAINAADLPGNSRTSLLRRAKKDIGKMRSWAKHAPENYLHKAELMRAEYARVKGKKEEANTLYDSSMSHAAEQKYLNEEALANEMAARHYESSGNQNLSHYYLRRAVQLYREWEAEEKVRHLYTLHPDVVSVVLTNRKRPEGLADPKTVSITTTVSEEGILDLNTVLKASESISGEIILEKLLRTLLSILMENLGATRGVLLFNSSEGLVIKAQSGTKGEDYTTVEDIELTDSQLVPESVIKFVRRTDNKVVVDDIREDTRFNQDWYVKEYQPISLLGFPIMHKGGLVGILYFENNLADSAFTSDRLQLLQMLSGQIAISIENALLYESLEQKVKDRTALLAAEKTKSDNLLLNILPRQTAEELKANGKATPRRYESVTVMFTDFKDFTRIAEAMDPTQLVDEIDYYFSAFDEIMEKYGLEKIKTIGDSYMCVGGLPEESDDHAAKIIQAAIEIRELMWKSKTARVAEGKPHFAIRFGIHTGPVVAGVVGSKKFAYDIWGDTVNTASRIETNCDAWEINISGATYELSKDLFKFDHRGKVSVKSKGEIDMYYLLLNLDQQ